MHAFYPAPRQHISLNGERPTYPEPVEATSAPNKARDAPGRERLRAPGRAMRSRKPPERYILAVTRPDGGRWLW